MPIFQYFEKNVFGCQGLRPKIAAIFNSIWRANEDGAKDAISFFDIFTASEAKQMCATNLSQLQEHSVQFSVSILNFFQEDNT